MKSQIKNSKSCFSQGHGIDFTMTVNEEKFTYKRNLEGEKKRIYSRENKTRERGNTENGSKISSLRDSKDEEEAVQKRWCENFELLFTL